MAQLTGRKPASVFAAFDHSRVGVWNGQATLHGRPLPVKECARDRIFAVSRDLLHCEETPTAMPACGKAERPDRVALRLSLTGQKPS